MERTIETREDYGRCDTGAASGQSACGMTMDEYCGMDVVTGRCDVSSGTLGSRSDCDTGAASGQSTCGQTGEECDDGCCC
jgi:hypothetical protein